MNVPPHLNEKRTDLKEQSTVVFNEQLIKRYNTNGPRYTSYPTAASFTDTLSNKDFIRHALKSNELLVPNDISLYVHIPFCDTLCFYCGCNKIATKNRFKADTYLDYLEKESSLMKKYFDQDRIVTQLHLGGGTPTFLTIKQIQRLMTILSDNWSFSPSQDRDFSIEIDPRSTSIEVVKQLAHLGFNRFSIGVQDLDPKVQKAINRIQPLKLTEEIIKSCRDHGAKSINVDLIYGLPFQTVDSFNSTLDEMIQLAPDRFSIFNYAHLPELFSPQKRINSTDLPTIDTKLKLFQMVMNKLNKAGYIYIGLDHFAKPEDELSKAKGNGTLQRNFQGYSTHSTCDLVSLGVSSISRFDGIIMQNEKELTAYYQHLDKDELAFARGVELTEDDKVRREIIQQLMCQNKVDLVAIMKQYRLKGWRYFSKEYERLKPLEDDGLVIVTPSGITITEKGRLFARNVAMIFDTRSQALLHQNFSKVI